MAITLSGVIRGRRIDLDQEVSLPDGAPVLVQIEPRDLSLQERRELVTTTAGSWGVDSSLEGIFEEIVRSRRGDPGRSALFDDPA
jgi:hypothetical protein